jgi:hypothetical protein
MATLTERLNGVSKDLGELSTVPERVKALETGGGLVKWGLGVFVAIWAATVGHLKWTP